MLVLRIYYSLFSSRNDIVFVGILNYLLIKEYSKHSCKWSLCVSLIIFLRFQGIKRILKGKFTSSKRCTVYLWTGVPESCCFPWRLLEHLYLQEFPSCCSSMSALVAVLLGKENQMCILLGLLFLWNTLACRIF